MPTYDFRDIIYAMEDIGFFEIVLPFLLVFTIVFAILEKTKILGKEGTEPRTNLNASLALIMSLLIFDQVEIVYKISLFIPKVALLAVVFLMTLFLFGILGGEREQGWSGGYLIFGGLFTMVMILWAFFTPEFVGDWYDFSYWWRDNWAVILGIIFFLLVIGNTFRSKAKSPVSNVVDYFFKNK